MSRTRAKPTMLARRGDLIVERDRGRPSGRLLLQAGMEASYVDLADPAHLEFDYMRWMRIVLRAAHARRVIHVGGGACALAPALAAEDPDGRQEVCEVDPEVLAVAREQLGLRRARGLRVRVAEGRSFVASQPAAAWDAGGIDALVNVLDDRSAHEVHLVAAALSAAYPLVWALGGRTGNTIVVGAARRLDLDRVAAQAAGGPSPARLTTPSAMASPLAGTPALRDADVERR